MHRLRFCQVHLGFHLPPTVEKVGEGFEKRAWQETIEHAHVEHVTLVAKCAYGWSYYPTRIGAIHPGLSFDLLRAQIEACQAIPIRTSLYLSTGFDQRNAELHPEWHLIPWKSSPTRGKKQPHGGFVPLCFHTPYLDELCRQIEEVVSLFPSIDGLFLDVGERCACFCPACLQRMKEEDLDPSQEEDRQIWGDRLFDRYYQKATEAGRSKRYDLAIFHQGNHLTRGRRDRLKYFSHFELASDLTKEGCERFVFDAKYLANLPHDFLGIAGSPSPGGGLDPSLLTLLRDASSTFLAFGGKCSVTLPLSSSGRLDSDAFSILEPIYAAVQAKEAWGEDSESMADIGLLCASRGYGEDPAVTSDRGATRILLEGHYLFDVLDDQMNFNIYPLLILPDRKRVDSKLKQKIAQYLRRGGKLLLTGESGMDGRKESFLFDVGASWEGEPPVKIDYLLPRRDLCLGGKEEPIRMARPSYRILVTTGESLGMVYEASSTASNQTTKKRKKNSPSPSLTPSGYDAGVLRGSILYLAHPVFEIYYLEGSDAIRAYLHGAIDLLIGSKKTFQGNLPASVWINLAHQKKEKRYILHLVTPPSGSDEKGAVGEEKKGKPVREGSSAAFCDAREARMTLSKRIRRVFLEPQGTEWEFTQTKEGTVLFRLAPFVSHQMIVFEY